MELVDLTPTPDEALPLAAFKAHLRLGSGFADDSLQDDLLAGYLRAALSAIEARTGKALFQRVFQWRLTDWSSPGAQPMPVAPVGLIATVELISASEVATEVEPARYRLEHDRHRPRLIARSGQLPTIATGGAAVVHFSAGYSDNWDNLPADLRQAVLLLAAHFYDNRHDVTGAGGLMPFGVASLLEPHRIIRLFGARS